MKLSLLLFLAFLALVNGLNFFTASVEPPDSQYSQLLSGNTVFETVYSTFNSTGMALIGGALLLSSGLLAIPFLPGPNEIEDSIHAFRNGPLGFIPKPGSVKKGSLAEAFKATLTKDKTKKAKPVVYSFDLDEAISERNYDAKMTQFNAQTTDESTSKFDNLGLVPGPPYKTPKPPNETSKNKHQIYINVDHPPLTADHKVSQVIEPVVNTITNAIKQTFRSAASTASPTNNRRYENLDDFYNNEIIQDHYGYPLDYDYDDNNQMTYASSRPNYAYQKPQKSGKNMDKLRGLKTIYSANPGMYNKNRFKPLTKTEKSETSYYVRHPKNRKPMIRFY